MHAQALHHSRCNVRAARKSSRPAAKAGASRVVVARPAKHSSSQQAQERNVRVQAADGAKIVKVAAEARWEEQVRSGRVKNVEGRDVSALLGEGWVLLDVRPPTEVEKVAIEGAVAVPLFVADPSNSVSSLLKKASAFGMGGWWLGGSHMIPNNNFLAEVQANIPKEAQVIVGCQKGLRSLAACEQLSRAGYKSLAWVNGGFDATAPGELPTVGGRDIRYAGIGGVSALLGWSEVQQTDGSGLFGGPFGIIKVAAVILVLDLLLFGVEFIQAANK